MIFSIILLVSNIIVGYLAIDYSESYHRVGSYYRQAYNEVNELKEKVNDLESELRNLREKVSVPVETPWEYNEDQVTEVPAPVSPATPVPASPPTAATECVPSAF